MKKILKLFDESKTLQIILDKCIIGIFILLAAFLININLEMQKLKIKLQNFQFQDLLMQRMTFGKR